MKRVFVMLVTAAMILSLVGCSSAPPNTGSSAANSFLDESTDSPGDTSQYNNDADGDTGYTDDITYNPSRDYVTGDNYTPIMDVETSTWGGSSDIDMGDMVRYCLSNITYGIDDGYSDGFYVVTISGTLKGGLAPYQDSIQGGQAVWLDVEITYHNDVSSLLSLVYPSARGNTCPSFTNIIFPNFTTEANRGECVVIIIC